MADSETDIEVCNNCGDKIGKLETPYMWQDHILCSACFFKMNRSQPPAAQPTTTAKTKSMQHPLHMEIPGLAVVIVVVAIVGVMGIVYYVEKQQIAEQEQQIQAQKDLQDMEREDAFDMEMMKRGAYEQASSARRRGDEARWKRDMLEAAKKK